MWERIVDSLCSGDSEVYPVTLEEGSSCFLIFYSTSSAWPDKSTATLGHHTHTNMIISYQFCVEQSRSTLDWCGRGVLVTSVIKPVSEVEQVRYYCTRASR